MKLLHVCGPASGSPALSSHAPTAAAGYDIAMSMWGTVHTLGDLPQKRTDHSVCLFRDSLLVFGGFDGHTQREITRFFRRLKKTSFKDVFQRRL